MTALAAADPGEWDDDPPPILEIEDLADLLAAVDAEIPPSYLLRGVMAEGDYGMLSAEFKAGKTWAATDLAVSIASGTPWLGAIEVEAPGPVLLFAGEGGRRKIARRIRAVCEPRGLNPAALPIRVCLRVPHLTNDAAMLAMADEIAATRPQLVIIDPLYLAARGAKLASIVDVGEHLERAQHLCQRHGAGLLIVHHWNKTGEGKGAKRMSGAGADAWGRVLISAAVLSRTTDDDTLASSVILDIECMGDEIADTTIRIRRRVWADDPDDLASPLHYDVTRIERIEAPADPELAGLRPSAVRVLNVLDTAGDWLTVRAIGGALADAGAPLKARTIQAALGQLVEARRAVAGEVLGGSAGRWRSARAQAEDEDGQHAF